MCEASPEGGGWRGPYATVRWFISLINVSQNDKVKQRRFKAEVNATRCKSVSSIRRIRNKKQVWDWQYIVQINRTL
ncbi:MAG: hypothetical protein DI535_26250 [Citrobacter freundii]|nr:MAG: hypothetical protein DI535_26250 [Citrobacter freundii]